MRGRKVQSQLLLRPRCAPANTVLRQTMMAHLSFACIPLFLLAAFVASPFVFCSHQGSVDAAEASNGQRAADKQRATELLNEFAGENDVAGLMAEYTNTPAPYVLVGEDRDDCPLVEGAQAAPVAVFLRHSQGVSTAPTLTIDSTGRSSGPCPKVFLQEIPYYGRKAAATSMGTGLPTTLGDLKRTVDLTRLGLDREFNEKAYQSLRVCNDFFFFWKWKHTKFLRSCVRCCPTGRGSCKHQGVRY